jgi:hypothetical protein
MLPQRAIKDGSFSDGCESYLGDTICHKVYYLIKIVTRISCHLMIKNIGSNFFVPSQKQMRGPPFQLFLLFVILKDFMSIDINKQIKSLSFVP